MKVFLFIIFVSFFLGIWAIPSQFDVARNEERIVGGSDTTIEEYPYAAQLYIRIFFHCGATIISPKWVLTAAHCTYGQNLTDITLSVGDSKYDQADDEIIYVAEVITHPLYNDTTYDYDISILLLNNSLTFGTTVAAIPLPSANVVLSAGTLATVVGWGWTDYTTEAKPAQLQKVSLPIITNEKCAALYANSVVYVTDRVLCTDYEAGGRDSCEGDSGGPLIVNGTLYGLVSNGIGCANPKFPATYTNVSSVRYYIQEVTGL